MKTWTVHKAKANFFRLIRLAQRDEPQHISRNREPSVVLMARADFDRLHAHQQSFVDFMRQSPLYGMEDIELERDKSPARDLTV